MPIVVPTLFVDGTRRPTEFSLPPWLHLNLVASTANPLPPLLLTAIRNPNAILQNAGAITAITNALEDIRAITPQLDDLIATAPTRLEQHPFLASFIAAALAPVATRIFRPMLMELLALWRSQRMITQTPTKEQGEALIRQHILPGVSSTVRMEQQHRADNQDHPAEKKRRT